MYVAICKWAFGKLRTRKRIRTLPVINTVEERVHCAPQKIRGLDHWIAHFWRFWDIRAAIMTRKLQPLCGIALTTELQTLSKQTSVLPRLENNHISPNMFYEGGGGPRPPPYNL